MPVPPSTIPFVQFSIATRSRVSTAVNMEKGKNKYEKSKKEQKIAKRANKSANKRAK
jgi:hypothetical protein